VAVGVVEATHDVENQETVLHRPAKVTKSICHALHPPAVLANGKIPLLEGAEGRIELKGPSLGIAKELTLESLPGLARGALGSANDILKI